LATSQGQKRPIFICKRDLYSDKPLIGDLTGALSVIYIVWWNSNQAPSAAISSKVLVLVTGSN